MAEMDPTLNDHGARDARLTRLVRAALIVLLVLVSSLSLVRLAVVYPPFVDLEIPLRAAERWMAGGDPYLASSFLEPPGYTLPFLYAPPTLPFFAVLALFPRPVAVALWLAACIAAAVFATRRVGVPWRAVPFVLGWPPFAQALLGGNVQIFLFAALVAAFWRRADRAWTPVEANPTTTQRPLRTGTLAAFVPAMKISTPHTWVAMARLNPRAAAMGAGVAVAIVAVTLPLVGVDLWTEWLDQVRRALDPGWSAGGHRIHPDLPLAITGAAWLGAVLACLVVPRDRAGTWVGLLAVIGAA